MKNTSFRSYRSILGLVLTTLYTTVGAQTLYVPSGTSGIGNSTTGNVGIGTASPGLPLHVVSSGDVAYLEGTASATGVGGTTTLLLKNSNSTANNYSAIANRNAVGGWTGSLEFINVNHNASGSATGDLRVVLNDAGSYGERLRLTAAGRLGIGTASPTALLQVGTTVASQGFKVGVAGNMANSNAEIRGSLAVLADGTSASSDVGAVAADYYNNGSSPSWSGALLRYYGSSYAGSVYGAAAANQGALVFQNVSTGVVATNGAPINIAPSGATAATFLANGNVGIGTMSPSHKLAVNGTIRAKVVIVDTGWSDYVFAEDYRLAPLSEVEAHIKEKKHLPGIPSAAEVEKDGVSLGEVQSKLLAKVEELTLHLIAQEKRIAALEAENNQLKQLK